MRFLLQCVALSGGILFLAGCSSSPSTRSQASGGFFENLSQEKLHELAVWCLKDTQDYCLGKDEELRENNNSGPDFYPSQRLTLLDWRYRRVGPDTAAFQFKIKDDGLVYDTTINVDSTLTFGPRGLADMTVDDIYGGDWDFSDGFVEAAVVAGAAAAILSESSNSSSTSSNSSSVERSNPCYSISDYGMREVCIKGTGTDACHGIKNYGLREVCLEGTSGKACHGLEDYGLREVCLNGTRSNACNGITNYGLRESCHSYSGDTTLWVLMAGHGLVLD